MEEVRRLIVTDLFYRLESTNDSVDRKRIDRPRSEAIARDSLDKNGDRRELRSDTSKPLYYMWIPTGKSRAILGMLGESLNDTIVRRWKWPLHVY